jgi:hypothetical protein
MYFLCAIGSSIKSVLTNLTASQLVKKSLALYGIPTFITAVARVRHWTLAENINPDLTFPAYFFFFQYYLPIYILDSKVCSFLHVFLLKTTICKFLKEVQNVIGKVRGASGSVVG